MQANSKASIQQGSKEELQVYRNLWNTVWPDFHVSMAELHRDLETLPPEQRFSFWIARIGEIPIGFLECHRDAGSYHPQKWTQTIGVLPEYRKAGVGSQLFDISMKFIRDQAPVSTMCRIAESDEDSLRFAASRGFEEVKRDFESVLYLAKLDTTVLDSMDSCEADIRTASELDSPEFRREWHEVFEVVRKDTPRAEPPTPMLFEQFEELVLNDPEFLWEGSQVALIDGRLVGFSGIYASEIEGQLFQWLTAVKAEHRGRNIAQGLKARSTRWARSNGYKAIRTDNDTRNAPMLSINDRMGFERLTGMITLVKRFAS